jgi:signal transduction histidine kinase
MQLVEEPPLSLAEKEAFYRIAQEALHNVVKHAKATQVVVRLANDTDAVRLEVSDNGIGFDASQGFPGHIGLISFNERAETIGATVHVDSGPGLGTTVVVSLPLSGRRPQPAEQPDKGNTHGAGLLGGAPVGKSDER